ncbi:hypothetical protein KCU65_g7825, partial [Aureobasidium melanogenum]
MYLRDDGRTRHGKLVVPDGPAAAPQAAAAPGGVGNSSLPIAPLHLWRGFSGHSVFTPINASGTPFPWTPNAAESAPARWQDFMPKKSSENVSLSLRQHPSSAAAAEKHKGDADGDGNEEQDDDDDDEMSEEDEEDEDNSQSANDMQGS